MNSTIKKSLIITVFTSLLMTVGCTFSYKLNGASINYNKVKTISFGEFPIKSDYVYAPLAIRFNEELKDAYIRQTRLKQVKRDGDLHIEGEIVGYEQINQAVKADGYSSEIQLKVTVNVRFTNNTNHAEDFEQKFSAFKNYDSRQLLTAVQDDLITQMNKEIVDQIFNQTVANW